MGLFFKEMLKEEIDELGSAVGMKKNVGMKKKKPQVVYKKDRQVGGTDVFRDKRRKAMPSGKRISKAGNVYYEYRRNRTDKVGSTL